MIKISNEKCYTGAEVVDALGAPFTLKRIEHLRNLGLIPRPVKVGTGNGTKGYYPEYVIDHLRKIDKQHRQGNSYPDLVLKMKNEIAIVEYKTQKVKDEYQARKAVERQVGIYSRLAASKHLGALVKLGSGQPNDEKVKEEELDAELRDLQDKLKKLFARKDNLSQAVLRQIKDAIERIQMLESAKTVLSQVHVELQRRSKD